LKHCAANRKRQLSALPNVGPYIYTMLNFWLYKELHIQVDSGGICDVIYYIIAVRAHRMVHIFFLP
jgi:hypothetical protein